MPTTWASFNNAAKRIQNGGWARQVTVDDFAISKEISGVNMRLTAGGIRELHWHQAAEWAIMTYGSCRVTVLDAEGRPYVGDVKAGDLWYFPPGAPHSLQGLGPDGCEFVICFDDGHADEFNTLLVSDWLAHTPPSVLAKNFGVAAETFAKIPLHNLWIFQGTVPGDLAADRVAIQKGAPAPTHPFIFPLGSSRPSRSSETGTIQVADSTNFEASTAVAAALVTIRPGAVRECTGIRMRTSGSTTSRARARMTVFNTGPNALTMDSRPATLVTSSVISAIMSRIPEIPIFNSSACFVLRATKKSRSQIGLRIRRRNWWLSTSTSTKKRSRNGLAMLRA